MFKIVDGIKYESITMPNGNITGWRLISNYNNKKAHINIPDNIEGFPIVTIEEHAFSCYPFLKSVKIPDSVEIIKKKAFSNCHKLENITVFQSSKQNRRECLSLYAGVFEGCHKLKFIACEKPCHLNGIDIFRDCFELFQIGTNNKIFGSIYANCFRNCVKLKTLHIVGNHCRLWTNCFYGCSNLNEVRFDCALVHTPKSVLSFLSKKHIFCIPKCNLTDLAYEGVNVEIVEV